MASPPIWHKLSLERFFQYLSNTDHDVIQSPLCTKSVRMTQTMLGVMVFITGVFAFLSASFAMNVAFDNVALAVLVGIFWGVMIIWFDRAIVSARDKRAILIRLPIALIIGFTVSIPLEIQLLKGRLDKFLLDKAQVENKDVIERRKSQIDSLQNRKNQLETDVKKYSDAVAFWSDSMEAETVGRVKEGRTGKSGQGPAYMEASRNKKLNEDLLEKTSLKLQELETKEVKEKEQIDSEFNNTKMGFRPQDYGFLSTFEALEELKDVSLPAWKLSWLLRLLFIFVELFPALLKLFLPYSIYDAILEASRRESVQLVHFIANQRINEIAATPSLLPSQLLLSKLNSTVTSSQRTAGHQTAMPPNQPAP